MYTNILACMMIHGDLCASLLLLRFGMVEQIVCFSSIHGDGRFFFITICTRVFNVTSFLVPLKLFPTFIPKLLETCSDYLKNQNKEVMWA
jgi:hypothetical protein